MRGTVRDDHRRCHGFPSARSSPGSALGRRRCSTPRPFGSRRRAPEPTPRCRARALRACGPRATSAAPRPPPRPGECRLAPPPARRSRGRRRETPGSRQRAGRPPRHRRPLRARCTRLCRPRLDARSLRRPRQALPNPGGSAFAEVGRGDSGRRDCQMPEHVTCAWHYRAAPGFAAAFLSPEAARPGAMSRFDECGDRRSRIFASARLACPIRMTPHMSVRVSSRAGLCDSPLCCKLGETCPRCPDRRSTWETR